MTSVLPYCVAMSRGVSPSSLVTPEQEWVWKQRYNTAWWLSLISQLPEEVGHTSFYITKKHEYHYRSVDSAGILCTVSTVFTLFVFISCGEASLSILVDKNHH